MDGKDYLRAFLRALLAGMMIGIGGCVFIGCSVRNVAWVGAVLFAIGLMTIFFFGMDLYTGKVGYAVNNKPIYIVYLLVVIVGNLAGCIILAFIAPDNTNMIEVVKGFITSRMDDPNYLKVFFKGILCGILMFIAADFYKQKKSFLAAFICVPVFILAGFEHSIADMFYFFYAGFNGLEAAFTWDSALFIVIVILGNAVGGILIPLCQKYMYDPKKE